MATSKSGPLALIEGVDAPNFADIEKQVFPSPWRAASFREGPAYRGWSFWRGDRMVAFLYVQKVLDEAEIIRIAVLPDWQRKGLAGRLWQALITNAECRDLERVSLEVSTANEPARAFYERLGFEISGRRRDYYAQGEDALTMLWKAPRTGPA